MIARNEFFTNYLSHIAVMFTFSFGSAMAAAPTNEQKTDLLAAENYALNIAEKNFTTALDDIGDETIDGYVIEEENWEALSAEMLKALKKRITDTTDAQLDNYTATGATTSALAEEVYELSEDYTVSALTSWIKSDFAVKAAAKQFAADQAELADNVDHVDLSLYSNTTPKTGDTYYQMAVKAIEAVKNGIYDPSVDVDTYNTVTEYKNRIDIVTWWVNQQIEKTYVGDTTIESGLYKFASTSDAKGRNQDSY